MRDELKAHTLSMYGHHKERAAHYGVVLNYTLGDLRTVVAYAVGGPCPYCGGPLTVDNFSADHVVPVGQGGSLGIGNIVICCKGCNYAKHTLAAAEFRALLALLETWPKASRENVLRRLRAGGRAGNVRGSECKGERRGKKRKK